MSKLILPTQRMLMVMDYVIANKVKGIDTKDGFFEAIGFKDASNHNKILAGTQSFKPLHYMNACQVFGIDGNFFLVKSHTDMLRKDRKIPALTQLKEAVNRIAVELNTK